MSKRKKSDPSPEDEEEDIDSHDKPRQQGPQKVYDFHKKTIEVYPQRLHELNQQFLSSISTQIQTEPYSVLVGNCLDYVRQYFHYEDDLLQYSPWLATRLKQSRSDIVKCLQETIDVYEALARHDFDRLVEKNTNQSSTNGNENSTIRPPTTSSSVPTFNFTKPTTTTTTNSSSESTSTFSFGLPKPTPTAPNADATPATGFSFKLPSTTTSPEKTTTTNAPFTFSMPNTGFGTSTFTSPSFPNPATTTSTASISFATPPKFSFALTPAAIGGDQQDAADDNDDEPSEPPEPEKVEHESDAKLTYRCRMGVNKGGKLIKRGPVQVIVKEANEKHQLIVRSDDTLGRLYLNIIWSKLIEMKKNSTKDLTFVCKLNPAMPEVKEGEFVMILFRFDSETDRNDAYEKLEKERT